MSALVDATDLRAELARPAPPVVIDVQWVLTGAPGPDPADEPDDRRAQ